MKKDEFTFDKNNKLENKFPVVAIGASAGGLDALKKFFKNLPSKTGMAFVIIQHLDPHHKSNMKALISRYTTLNVHQVEDGMTVEPDHVYIIPPNRDMGIMNGVLQLMEPSEPHGLRLPINYFLKNLADDQGARSIAIIFSGFGSDGTLSIKAIKAAGGMVMAQDPETAESDSMPASAIGTGLVDLILPPEKMPEKLINYVESSKKPIKKILTPKEESNQVMQKIFMLIRRRTNHDFSYYKENTIFRRIGRRMNVHQIKNVPEYLHYLQENPLEIDILFKELLINVTNFFRDPEAFESFKRNLKEHIDQKNDLDNLRVWVPGCSSGEEVYSIGILIAELMEEIGKDLEVQIFGTDIDNEAIKTARSGSYSHLIAEDINPDYLKKYFIKKDDTYIIRNDIREMVVFAPHDVIKDPPFTKLDVLSCRNLLIYLNNDAQQKALSNFNYALNNNGILFLGPSESVGDFTDGFPVADKKWKIFKCVKSTDFMRRFIEIHPIVREIPTINIDNDLTMDRLKNHHQTANIVNTAEKKLLSIYVPPSAIITETGEIVYIHGRLGKYLEPAPGKPRLDINEMAREGLKFELRSAIQKAVTIKKEVMVENLRVKVNGDHIFTTIRVKPLDLKIERGLLLVSFEDVDLKKDVKETKEKMDMVIHGNERIQELEEELQLTKDRLNTYLEDMKSSNEELRSANEELQSMNEEAQSTNEELETSKEELQSINEEMATINNELNMKIDELNHTQDDLNNLINSVEIAIIFLDKDLNIRRFTKESTKIIKMIQSDIGRPFSDISTTLKYKNMIYDIRQVLDNVIFKEKDVETEDGNWYHAKIIPYKTAKNVIEGVIITFTNIIKSKKQYVDAMQLSDWAIQTSRGPQLVLDGDKRVFSANQPFYHTYKLTPEETIGNRFYDLGEKQWNISPIKKLLEEILPKNNEIEDYIVEEDFKTIGHRKISINARRTYQNGTVLILLGLNDVTDE